MDSINKKKLSESDICDLFITPAVKNAGWDQARQVRREVTLTPGPVVVRGNMSARNKKKKKFADYVLSWEPGIPIAVIEAKDNSHTVSHGMQQALGYAEILEYFSGAIQLGMTATPKETKTERSICNSTLGCRGNSKETTPTFQDISWKL